MVLLLGCREGAAPPADTGPLSRLILRVPDVEATCSRVLAAGGAVHREPSVRGSGERTFKVAHVADLDGNRYEVIQGVAGHGS
jgi:predicted enzyme related to lactoylglutathione lyase